MKLFKNVSLVCQIKRMLSLDGCSQNPENADYLPFELNVAA